VEGRTNAILSGRGEVPGSAPEIPNKELVARRFESALWEKYGLTGRLVPDEILKECARRLRAAPSGSEEELQLEEDLQFLDYFHQYRMESSIAFAQAYPLGEWWDFNQVQPSESMRSKGSRFWALIIGNDTYEKSPLGGCVNDTNLVRRFLLTYLNVPSNQIHSLVNADRDTMVNALYDLRDNNKIRYGDNILIHYSGHGSSYKARDFFQSESARAGSIEAICPVDRSANVPDISERELSSILSEIHAAKGPNITIVFDCCHSGGALRSSKNDVRYIPPIEGPDGIRLMFRTAELHPRRASNALPLTSEDWEADVSSFVQLAACQDFQLAKEKNFETTEDSHHEGRSPREVRPLGGITGPSLRHGLFTFALIKILKSDKGRDVTYESVIELMGRLADMQVPVVVGSRKNSRLWFEESDSIN